jgi:DNA-binding MarR family transcriptional regulator
VAILDKLEKRGLVERSANTEDRRLYSLHLTKGGDEGLDAIREVAREHQEALLSTLDSEERETLAALLIRIADQQGLTRGVHPGYQRLGEARRRSAKDAKRDLS